MEKMTYEEIKSDLEIIKIKATDLKEHTSKFIQKTDLTEEEFKNLNLTNQQIKEIIDLGYAIDNIIDGLFD